MRRLALAALVACVFVTLVGLVLARRACYFSQEPDASQSGRLRWVMPGSKKDRCACTSIRPGPVNMQAVRWSHPPFYTDTPIFTNDPEDIHDYFNCHDILECSEVRPLGMEDGRIRNASITVSSMWNDWANFGPTRARLNLETKSGSAAWCDAGSSDANSWIQVELGSNVIITGVITQGRGDYNYGNLDRWVTEFKVAFSDDGVDWTDVTNDGSRSPMKIGLLGTEDGRIPDASITASSFWDKNLNYAAHKFPGNSDKNTHVTTTFPKAFQARFLRILSTQWSIYCSMRFEVLGCRSHE
ncbi:lactadherin-like [Patiria miniata]|uniref:F5/8 type C domain-containing protein n=1 Tax=Patiria miniata TaxID=46514 RepID=A0A914A9J6_PATMI|nr:lactadherin-like [Patiria miniata]